MFNSKIISLLKTFTPHEFKRFDDYVHSPFFNKAQSLSNLFDEIKKYYPEFNNEMLSKHKIFDNLYHGNKFNDERMRNLSSDLLSLGKGFLAQTKYLDDPFFPNKFLLDGLKEKRLDILYKKQLESSGDYLENIHRFDGSYFLYKTHLEISRITFYLSRNMLEPYFNSYLDFSEHIAVYLLSELVAACEGIHRSGIMINLKLKNNLVETLIRDIDFEKLISDLRKKDSKYAGFLEIYFSKYNAFLKTGEDKYYYIFRDLFYKNMNLLSRKEKYNLYTDILTFCHLKTRSGNENFTKEAFEVNKKMLGENIYSYQENDFINVIFYRSIVSRCAILRESEWLEKFTIQYTGKLNPAFRENMSLYSNALIYFIRNDFEKTLEYFSRIGSPIFEIKLDIKNFSLMCYYELSAFEQALSMIDSYEHFLFKNKSITPASKDYYGKFIKYAGLLIKSKLESEKINLSKLYKEIVECTEIANKQWLLKKTKGN